MLVYNIVSRVANGKDFFEPVFECLGKVKRLGISIRLNIIGNVYNEDIFERLIALSHKLAIDDNVHFTKRSISYNDMEEEIKEGYFLNFSLGDFVGYSTLEAMNFGFKVIILNFGQAVNAQSTSLSFCNTISDLYDLTIQLEKNEKETRERIIDENIRFKNRFFLNQQEKDLLLSMF